MDFSREGARPGPGPRSSRHPPPLTSPESCQNQLRTGLCVLGRPRRGIRDRPAGAEGGGEGTSIGEETGCVGEETGCVSRGRQRADEWVEHGHSSIREVVDSVAGPTRGWPLPPPQPPQLSSAHLISSSNSQVLGSQGGEAGLSFAPSLSFACPGLAYFGQQSLDSSQGTIQIQQKQCFSWKAELRWDEGCGQAGPQREGRGWGLGVGRDKI